MLWNHDNVDILQFRQNRIKPLPKTNNAVCNLKPLGQTFMLEKPWTPALNTGKFSLSIPSTELIQSADVHSSCPLYSRRRLSIQYLDKCEKTTALCSSPVWLVIVKHQNKYHGRKLQTFHPTPEKTPQKWTRNIPSVEILHAFMSPRVWNVSVQSWKVHFSQKSGTK